MKQNYSQFEGIKIEDEPVDRKSDADISDISDICTDNTTPSDTSKTVENEKENASSKELVSFQDMSNMSNMTEPSSKASDTFNPIVSVEDFFDNDIPLFSPEHPLEQSPCYPIITSRVDIIHGSTEDGEGNLIDVNYTNTVYYCRLHPELGSTFLGKMEFHCKEIEPDRHRAEILSRITKPESEEQQ